MKWINSLEQHGWIGENGYKIILVDFHAGRAFYEIWHNNKLVPDVWFDADDLDKAKSFVENLP